MTDKRQLLRIAVFAAAFLVLGSIASQASVRVGIGFDLGVPAYGYNPGPGYVWVPPHQCYRPTFGYGYVPGAWAAPPYADAVWAGPHWSGSVFVGGYWRHGYRHRYYRPSYRHSYYGGYYRPDYYRSYSRPSYYGRSYYRHSYGHCGSGYYDDGRGYCRRDDD